MQRAPCVTVHADNWRLIRCSAINNRCFGVRNRCLRSVVTIVDCYVNCKFPFSYFFPFCGAEKLRSNYSETELNRIFNFYEGSVFWPRSRPSRRTDEQKRGALDEVEPRRVTLALTPFYLTLYNVTRSLRKYISFRGSILQITRKRVIIGPGVLRAWRVETE